GDIEAGLAIVRLSGDPQPLLTTLHSILAAQTTHLTHRAHAAAQAGGALRPLIPALLAHLTGTAARAARARDIQVPAARLY
ncbi:hypothetical protein NL526_29875, partial [Klebsiella pneumoniae]|nr:hypothetical protein [Klebsiella pneumoniae]